MRMFAKRLNEFDPTRRPTIEFDEPSNRDALIFTSEPGDCLVLVGSQSDKTVEGARGKLLGIAEFARIALDRSSERASDGHDSGAVPWRPALPIVRAWRFRKPLLSLNDVLQVQLAYEPTARSVLLGKSDTDAVLTIPRLEIALWQQQMRIARPNASTEPVIADEKPTTGPIPTDWEGVVRRSAGTASWTYVFRFGERNLWKIGHTQDVLSRLAEVNRHVPYEETGEQWSVFIENSSPNSLAAYEVEQAMLGRLSVMRTTGERLRCPEAAIISAWKACVG